jgi:hypothetical protein
MLKKDASGRVTDPGKFAGEMIYVPYFWELCLMDGADWEFVGNEEVEICGVQIAPDDRTRFPELKVEDSWIFLQENNEGFVHAKVMNEADSKEYMDSFAPVPNNVDGE